MTFDDFKTEYALRLNPQQEQAVQSVDGNILLLAVPGSGKTTVLVTRLGYMLLGCHIPPRSILTMTYTVAATHDMKSRFAGLFGEPLASQLEFRTINGVCARILQQYERMMGRRAFTLLDDEKQLNAVIRELYRRQKEDYPTDSEIKGIRAAITYVKNQMLKDDEIEVMEEQLSGFPGLYHAYQAYLLERKAMDYDDQMVYALQILRRYPEILSHFRDTYRYICVDEAQDTSRIQHTIIGLLAQCGGNLFMVGDEDQSIYGFRAAYPEALLRFESDHPGAKVLLMEQNYRSTREIVAVADGFIQKNENRHPKRMTAVRGSGMAVKNILLKDRSKQYGYLLRVAENCQRETAVLYRDNDCALPLIDLLERKKIPYSVRRMDSNFFTHRVVRDIVDIILFAQNPSDGALFEPIYYKFKAGISKASVQKAIRYNRDGQPLLQLLSEDSSLSPYTRRQCKALQTHCENLLHVRADRAVYRIVHFMGYGDYLEERGADASKAVILEALGAQEDSPAGLLRRLDELKQIMQAKETSRENFILSTVHSAKGLEYDRVFLMDVIDGICPKTGEDTDDDEERRIFYVAMTRAKNELSMFTFQDESCASSFAAEVFPPTVTQAPVRGKSSSARGQVKTSTPSDAVRWAAKDYIPGVQVEHTAFGPGRVISVKGGIVTVRFRSGATKSLLLATVLEKKLLRLMR